MIAAVLIVSGLAAAAWKEYSLPQLGFVVEFPADPVASTVNYKTALVPSAPAHIYSVKEGDAVYVAIVVDLLDRQNEGASILGEAEFNLQLLGDVSGNTTSRVNGGRQAVFGRFITIDCRRGRIPDQPGQDDTARAYFKNLTGVECSDGTRLTVNVFFHRGRLYLLQGITPRTTDEGSFGPSALRFAISLSFLAPEGTKPGA